MKDFSPKHFEASGKLMITGEYLVLDGAKAWAVPTRFGQSLTPLHSPGAGLKWQSLDLNGNVWFQALWDGSGKLLNQTDIDVAETLHRLLTTARSMGASPFNGWNIRMDTDFPAEWGLGSSSSLVATIAMWLQVDPYQLFDRCLTGSGYDVAVAFTNHSLIYTVDREKNRTITPVHHTPDFSDQLFFCYSGNKQKSSSEVVRYELIDSDIRLNAIPELDRVTDAMLNAETLNDFQSSMEQHEGIVGTVLGRDPLKSKWKNLTGMVKSLGAWGGDFFLLATDDMGDLNKLKDRGIEHVFPWKEILRVH